MGVSSKTTRVWNCFLEDSREGWELETLNCLFLVIVIVDTEQNKQTVALIGGAAAAGGLGLIAFIALAVLFVKYRIARLLMNRNKVGDLYTTQDQQLSRKHAYIQEDDMIDKEDAS